MDRFAGRASVILRGLSGVGLREAVAAVGCYNHWRRRSSEGHLVDRRRITICSKRSPPGYSVVQ